MGMALGMGLGLPQGGITPAWNFASLNTLLGAAALSWFEAASGYLIDGGGAPITDGASVTKWIDRRDTKDVQAFPFATATGSGLLWGAAGKSVTFDGTNYLTLNTPVVVAAAGGAVYLVVGSVVGAGVGYRGTTSSAIQSGSGSGGNIIVQDDTGNGANGASPFSGGLIRLRRFNVATVRIAGTGAVEYDDALGADLTIGTIGASVTSINPVGATVRAALVVNNDTLAAGTDGPIRSYLQSTFGVAL